MKHLPLFFLATVLFSFVSCNKPAPVKGDKLNDFFPGDGSGHQVVVTTEQKGFAQASLKTGGAEVATLAISDLLEDPEAQKKFDNASGKIGGYPAIPRGNMGTAVLAGRFQVQVRSKTDTFTEADRKAWLEKFNLGGLAKLR